MPQLQLPSLKDFSKLIPQIKIAEVLLRGLDNFISKSRTSDQGNYAMLIMVPNHTANYGHPCWFNLKIKLRCLVGVVIRLANLHLKRFSSTLSSSPAEEEKGEGESSTEGLFSLSCYCWFCMSNVHHFTFWGILECVARQHAHGMGCMWRFTSLLCIIIQTSRAVNSVTLSVNEKIWSKSSFDTFKLLRC